MLRLLALILLLVPGVRAQLLSAIAANVQHGGGGATFYSRSITLDQPASDLTNFPVVVTGTYAYLATVANGGKVSNASGYDVVFGTDDECMSRLDWEVVLWSATTGAVEYWVRIPTLTSASPYVFYICYGDASITTDQSDGPGTWNSNYISVWHLPNGSSLSANDSTSNGNNGTAQNGPVAYAGIIDGGVDFTPGGSANTRIEDTSGSNLPTDTTDHFSFGAWAKASTYSALNQLFGFGETWPPGTNGISRYALTFADNYYFWGRNADWDTGVAFDADGAWHHWMFTFDGTDLTFFLDGSQAATRTGLPAGIANAGSAINAGGDASSSNPSQIKLDEARISDVARSATWIATEYSNQNDPAAFYAVGTETPHGGGGGITLISSESAVGEDGGTTSAMNATGANFLVCAYTFYGPGTEPTCMDSLTSTYSCLTLSGQDSGGGRSRICYAANITGGSGFTGTITGMTSYSCGIFAAFSGVKTTSPLVDENDSLNDTPGTTHQPGSVTPAAVGDLLLGLIQQSAAAASSVNSSYSFVENVAGSGGVNYGCTLAYKVATGTSAENPTFTFPGSVVATGSAAVFSKP